MRILIFTFFAVMMAGCAAIQLKKGADQVRIDNIDPRKRCEFIGEVTGSQGNVISGRYTSVVALETGALNELRNKAHDMGGNVVFLITKQAGYSGQGYLTRQTSVAATGSVYRCPEPVD